MKLWSIQNRAYFESSSDESLTCDWKFTPENWRFAYRWMVEQWSIRVGTERLDAPIWCWHSCNGQHGAPPTVGTVAMLMGDWEYYAASMVILELAVPDEIVLLSSYSRWNNAVDDALDLKSQRIRTGVFSDMFDSPLMKHATDDIQAVIPRVHPSWIVDIRLVPDEDSDWDKPFWGFPTMGAPIGGQRLQ